MPNSIEIARQGGQNVSSLSYRCRLSGCHARPGVEESITEKVLTPLDLSVLRATADCAGLGIYTAEGRTWLPRHTGVKCLSTKFRRADLQPRQRAAAKCLHRIQV